jgi:hypothetical protein
MLIQKKCLNVRVVFREPVQYAGSTAECLTIIESSAFIPIPYASVESKVYTYSDIGYIGETINITLEENAWIRTNVKFYQRGIYDFGTIKLNLFDLLHIFEYIKDVDCGIKVKVYPKNYGIKKVPFGGRDIYQETIDDRSRNEDMFSIKDVRKYREGDSLKKIHWKVSARHGELYVRDYEAISGEEFMIFVDMSGRNYTFDKYGEIEEQVVDLCVSLVSYMQEKGIQAAVLMNTLYPVSVSIGTREKLNSFIEFLITQKSDGNMEFTRFVNENVHRAQRMNTIAVVAPDINAGLAECMVGVKNSGYSIAAFYCRDDIDSQRNKELLQRSGIQCYSLDDILNRA